MQIIESKIIKNETFLKRFSENKLLNLSGKQRIIQNDKNSHFAAFSLREHYLDQVQRVFLSLDLTIQTPLKDFLQRYERKNESSKKSFYFNKKSNYSIAILIVFDSIVLLKTTK